MQSKKYRVAFYSVIFFLITAITTQVSAASKALIRFTYKLHPELSSPEFQNAYIQRLNFELNLVCKRKGWVTLNSFEDTPHKLVQKINKLFKIRASQCSQGQNNLNNLDFFIDLKQRIYNFTGDRYVIFASESTLRMESSLGHIAILYLEPENIFFSPTISFSADSIHKLEVPISTVEYYFKGGFSNLNGEVRADYFFDHYWDLVKQDGRNLEKYKIIDNGKNLLNKFDNLLTKSFGKKDNYNFFSKNCSTKLLNMLLEAKEDSMQVKSFEPPAKHLTQLIELGHIKYEETIQQNQDGIKLNYFDQHYLKNSNIHPSSIEILNDSHYSNLSIFIYEKKRPWNGYQNKYEISRIGGIEYEQKKDKGVLTLIEKSTLQDFETDGISSFIGMGYRNSITGYYYAGYSLYSNGIGTAASIGCNIKRGCGVLTSFIYSHDIHDLQLSYLVDQNSNDFSLHYFNQFSRRLMISLKYQSEKSWIGFRIKF
jgi:hypothetical protein